MDNFNHIAMVKAQRAPSALACEAAIADCHDTLRAGGYTTDDQYGQKLWAEIDAYRDRLQALRRAATGGAA